MTKPTRSPFMEVPVYIVMRPFTFAGKKYRKGKTFTPAKVNCDSRRARQLYEGRWLSMAPAKKETKKAA